MAAAPTTEGPAAPQGVRIECGELGLSDWSSFRQRALGILRKSSNQRKCLELMRVKARGLLGLDSGREEDDFGVKEGEEGSARPSASPPQFEEQQDERQEEILEEVPLQVPQIEIEVISIGVCKLAGSWMFTVSETQPKVAEVVRLAVTEFMSAKTDSSCDVKDHARTLRGDDVLSIGVTLLQLDDEPPDPGEALLHTKHYDTSVHICPRAVVCFGLVQEKNIDVPYTYSLRGCLIPSEKIVLFRVEHRASSAPWTGVMPAAGCPRTKATAQGVEKMAEDVARLCVLDHTTMTREEGNEDGANNIHGNAATLDNNNGVMAPGEDAIAANNLNTHKENGGAVNNTPLPNMDKEDEEATSGASAPLIIITRGVEAPQGSKEMNKEDTQNAQALDINKGLEQDGNKENMEEEKEEVATNDDVVEDLLQEGVENSS
ncbi:hypothetical protein ACQ4PT_044933 [Festuca glaucescens]